MQKQSPFSQNSRSRLTSDIGCFGCLASLVRITLALVALSALGLWGFDLWVRTTLNSKPLSEHFRDQRQDIASLFGTTVSINEDGQRIDGNGKVIPIPEVANACLGKASNPAPPPEAWKIFDSTGSRAAARGFVLDKGNGYGIPSLALSADGKTLVSGGKQGRVWDIPTRKLRYNLSGPVKFVNAVALSPDGKTIASGDYNGEIWLYDLNTGKLKQKLNHQARVEQLVFTADGKSLFGSDMDGNVRRWNLESRQQIHFKTRFPAQFIVLLPDERSLAIAAQASNAIEIVNSSGEMQDILIHGNQVDAIALSPSRRILASGSGSPQGLRLWDLQRKPGREPIKTLRGHNGQPFAIAFSPDGKTLFATGDGTDGRNYAVTVWNACSGELVHRFGEQVRGSALAVSRDGKTVVAGDRKGNLQMWNLL